MLRNIMQLLSFVMIFSCTSSKFSGTTGTRKNTPASNSVNQNNSANSASGFGNAISGQSTVSINQATAERTFTINITGSGAKSAYVALLKDNSPSMVENYYSRMGDFNLVEAMQGANVQADYGICEDDAPGVNGAPENICMKFDQARQGNPSGLEASCAKISTDVSNFRSGTTMVVIYFVDHCPGEWMHNGSDLSTQIGVSSLKNSLMQVPNVVDVQLHLVTFSECFSAWAAATALTGGTATELGGTYSSIFSSVASLVKTEVPIKQYSLDSTITIDKIITVTLNGSNLLNSTNFNINQGYIVFSDSLNLKIGDVVTIKAKP